MTDSNLTEDELSDLERLETQGSPAPWRAMVEGRDHSSGDSFIMVGDQRDRGEDVYVSRDGGPASATDLDLIASARTHLPRLLAEIRRLRQGDSETPTAGDPPAAPEMLWLVECPFQDQGLVRPLVTSSGALVLMCDEGGEVWLHPNDVSREAAIVPTQPDWRVASGIDIVPGTTRWAGRSDVETAGLETEWRT